jgi:hypothetical protein
MKISKGKRVHMLALCENIADRHAEESRPYVCGGCYAIGSERHAPWCIEGEIERRQEEREWSDHEDGDVWDEGDDERAAPEQAMGLP